jgi:CSLREA domain-containing protein
VNATDDVDDGACDASHCSLREAIIAANALPGADFIGFDISGAAPYTIAPTSPLPTIIDSVTIDGTTEPDFAGAPIVEISGANLGLVDGLTISSGGSTIRGLVINRFGGDAIKILIGGGNVVEGCYIGTDVSGAIDLGNGQNGVHINTAPITASADDGRRQQHHLWQHHQRRTYQNSGATGNLVQNFISKCRRNWRPGNGDNGVQINTASATRLAAQRQVLVM